MSRAFPIDLQQSQSCSESEELTLPRFLSLTLDRQLSPVQRQRPMSSA